MKVMRTQEIYTRAVVGLRSQGFQRSTNGDKEFPESVYVSADGCRCAWGWVDLSLTADSPNTYYVEGLAQNKIGIAPQLDLNQLDLVSELQWCHDDSSNPQMMERRLKRVGERWGLKWPVKD